jgi:hypothetical protein
MLIAMAGSAAQCRYINVDLGWTEEGKGDRRLAERYTETCSLLIDDFSLIDAIISQIEVWEQISRLADALLKHGHLVSWDGLNEFLPEREPKTCEMAGIRL